MDTIFVVGIAKHNDEINPIGLFSLREPTNNNRHVRGGILLFASDNVNPLPVVAPPR